MYMFEGRDYSKETSENDKTAFDNMIASKSQFIFIAGFYGNILILG